ncbi:MAG: poly granule associated family protein [Variovorax sp.]|nr:poly granule associated family protein [Variovorax sp.]
MVTRAPTLKLAPAKKAAPAKKRAAAGKTDAAAASKAKPGKAEVLLRAGLKALGNVRDDVVKRQTNVIEGLLGIQPKGDGAPARGFPSLDSFGIRKFEDVFDQRVATALERLGMPTLQEIQALRDEVRELHERLDRVDPQARTVAKTPASPSRRKR